MARPTKLDPDVQARIVALVRAGNSIALSAEVAGTSRTRAFAWLQRGRAEDDGPYHDFAAAVDQARSEVESFLVTQAGAEWRGAAMVLENRFPTRWARPKVRRLSSPSAWR